MDSENTQLAEMAEIADAVEALTPAEAEAPEAVAADVAGEAVEIASNLQEMLDDPEMPAEIRALLQQAQAEVVVGEGMDEGEQYQLLVQNVLQMLNAVYGAGDQPAMLLINPDLEAGFLAVWQSLPEEVLPVELRDSLRVVTNENVPDVQIVTGRQVEYDFLFRIFGPKDAGGNGLLPAMDAILSAQPVKVRVTGEALRCLYLLRIADQAMPKVQAVRGSELQIGPGQVPPGGVDRLLRVGR